MTIFRGVAEGESSNSFSSISDAATLNLEFHGGWKLFASVFACWYLRQGKTVVSVESNVCIFKFGRELKVFVIYLTITRDCVCDVDSDWNISSSYRNYMKKSASLICFLEFLFDVIYIVTNSGWANFTSGIFEKHKDITTLKKWNSQVEGNLILRDVLLLFKFDLELPN